jgi:hypothetical protein
LGALAQTNGESGTRFHVATAVVAAALLITLRSLGPLWAFLILGTALLAWPGLGRRIWAVVRSPSGIAAVAFLAALSIGSLAWILIQDSLVIGREDTGAPIPFAEKVEIAAQRGPQWVLQWIGAFPYRAQPAPAVVYVIFLLLLGWMLVVALRHGSTRYRTAIAATLVLSLLIPFVITVATLDEYGTSWQGRYGLPYLLGLPLLFGVVLAERLSGWGLRAFMVATVPLLAVGHAASVVGVLNRERRDSPQSGTESWKLMPPSAVLAVLVVCGVCLALVPLVRSSVHRGGAVS